MKAPQWKITAAAAALTALIAGSRTSFGLFLSPINTATGLGMASISRAAAVEHTGGYAPLWLADMVLALVAAALQWPLRPAALPGAPSAASRGRPACATASARPSA